VAFIAVTAIGKYPRAHWVLATVGYAHDLTLPLLGLPDDTSLEAVLRARSNFALEVRVLAEVSRVLQGEPPVFSHSVQIPAPEGRTIRARVYSHRSALNASAAPALIFFHGGGHVVCSMDDYDWIARRMANRLKSVRVISIDYRLAPEAPYPAAVHDAFNSTRYIIEHAAEFKINPKRVAVGGDSAGGNLATVVALLWREHKLAPQLAFQLLIYPATSLVLKKSASSQVHTVLLSEGMMRWFAHHYVGKSSRAALPTVSPLRAANLSGLPPAHFLLAKEDVLRMDAEEYAAKMQSAGVDVSITVAESMIHGFLFFDGIVPACTALLDEAASALLASI
jgi:acetyl esterase